MRAHSRVPVKHGVDPALLRAHDTPVLYGSRERLTEACEWKPQIPLEQTIEDTLDWWRERLGAAKADALEGRDDPKDGYDIGGG